MKAWLVVAALAPLAAAGQQAEIQRALIERDRQSAEFSRPELRELHQRQDQEARPARPDERAAQARERETVKHEEKAPAAPDHRPLPLPGGPRHGVDPIPVQGVGG